MLLLIGKGAPSESLGNTRSKDAQKALDESSPSNFTCKPLQRAGISPVRNQRFNVQDIDDQVAVEIHELQVGAILT